MAVEMDSSNTSGQGSTAVVPAELKGWNWGAFFLSWIWSIGNSTWIGLIALVPYAGFIMAIVLGVKGNEWAWQNRRWESVEQFKATQKVWAIWGLILFMLSLIVMFASIIVPIILGAHAGAVRTF